MCLRISISRQKSYETEFCFRMFVVVVVVVVTLAYDYNMKCLILS